MQWIDHNRKVKKMLALVAGYGMIVGVRKELGTGSVFDFWSIFAKDHAHPVFPTERCQAPISKYRDFVTNIQMLRFYSLVPCSQGQGQQTEPSLTGLPL
jgi:hypothetical protein